MTEQIFKPKVYRELKMGWPLLILFFIGIHYLQYDWIFALINLIVMMFVFFGTDMSSVLCIKIDSQGIRRYAPYKWLGFLGFGRQFDLPYDKIHRIEVICEGVQARKLVITNTSFWQYTVHSSAYKNFDKIINLIQQHIHFESHPVETQRFQAEDVGQRAANLLLVAIILNALALFSASFFSLLHVSSEHWDVWLLFTIPVAFIPAYLWIKGEKKANPLATSIIIGCLIGIGINLILLMLNRFYTEQHATDYEHTFVLLQADRNQQKWQLPVQIDPEQGVLYIRAKNNPGYINTLKPGHTYQISVKQGFLNDIAFAPDAFKNAQEVRAAQQPKNKVIDNEGD